MGLTVIPIMVMDIAGKDNDTPFKYMCYTLTHFQIVSYCFTHLQEWTSQFGASNNWLEPLSNIQNEPELN